MSTTTIHRTEQRKFARAATAIVRTQTMQGKGHVIRRMFADIEANFYILVDSDATYEAAAAPRLVVRSYQDGLVW